MSDNRTMTLPDRLDDAVEEFEQAQYLLAEASNRIVELEVEVFRLRAQMAQLREEADQ